MSDRIIKEKRGKPYEAFLFPLFFIGVLVSCGLLFLKDWLPELASNRGNIDFLYYVILTATGIVFFGVFLITAYLIWKYNEGTAEPAHYLPENTKLEITWTVLTALIICAIGVLGVRVWTSVALTPAPAGALSVEAVGQQFAWAFRYASPDGVFAPLKPETIGDDNPLGLDVKDPHFKTNLILKSDLYLPVNRPVRIFIRATDVLHSFFLPNFRVKQDAVPGMTVETSFTPTKIGDYEVACAQLCGVSHYTMRGNIHILSLDDFNNKIKALQKSHNIETFEGEKGEK